MSDRSTDPTVIQYAVQEMFKRKGPAAAANATAKKLSGFENVFLGPGVTEIDPRRLEGALWGHLVANVVSSIQRVRPGFEVIALRGVVSQFYLKTKDAARLRALVVQHLGGDPFGGES